MPTRIASRSLPVLLLACLLVLLAKAATLTGRASVVSGDTIEIHGTPIRLHGIDAPEREQTCRRDREIWRCGQQAALALQRRIDDRPVRCTEWHRDPDGHGHIVAKCLVDGEDLSEWLLRNGWAVAMSITAMSTHGRSCSRSRTAEASGPVPLFAHGTGGAANGCRRATMAEYSGTPYEFLQALHQPLKAAASTPSGHELARERRLSSVSGHPAPGPRRPVSAGGRG